MSTVSRVKPYNQSYFPIPKGRLLSLFFAFLALWGLFRPPTGLNADERNWYDSIFIQTAIQNYAIPEEFDGYIKPKPGFRAALGYEYKGVQFALGTGYTHIEGTNPLVLDLKLIPLSLSFGYELPIYKKLGAQASLNYGMVFWDVVHYESAIHMLKNVKNNGKETVAFGGLRLYGTCGFPGDFVKLYVGGGLDAAFEDNGVIPLPVLEAGISIKPTVPVVMLADRRKKILLAKQQEARAIENLVFAPSPDNIVIEETAEGKTVRILNAVYFAANSMSMLEKYRPILDEAGTRLRDNPELLITLRAYAAPFGTRDGQQAVSAARAWFCMEYYMTHFGIAEERMKIEYYGAEKMPEFKDASWESYRCVELIIQQESK